MAAMLAAASRTRAAHGHQKGFQVGPRDVAHRNVEHAIRRTCLDRPERHSGGRSTLQCGPRARSGLEVRILGKRRRDSSSATFLPRLSCSARYTMPIPPRPISASIRSRRSPRSAPLRTNGPRTASDAGLSIVRRPRYCSRSGRPYGSGYQPAGALWSVTAEPAPSPRSRRDADPGEGFDHSPKSRRVQQLALAPSVPPSQAELSKTTLMQVRIASEDRWLSSALASSTTPPSETRRITVAPAFPSK